MKRHILILVAGIIAVSLIFGAIKVVRAQEIDLTAFMAQLQSIINSISQQIAVLQRQTQDASRGTTISQTATPTIQSITPTGSATGVVDLAKPPAAPTVLIGCGSSQTSLCMKWNDNSNNEYVFEIEEYKGSAFVNIATTTADVVTYTHTGLLPGSYHVYRVRASNRYGSSSYSNTAGISTLPFPSPTPTPPPLTPKNLQSLPVDVDRVILSWNVEGAPLSTSTPFLGKLSVKKGYSPSTLAEIATMTPSTLSYDMVYNDQDSVFFPGTNYYRVDVEPNIGTSTSSNLINVFMLASSTAPLPPFILTGAISSTTKNINLNWYDNSYNETSFNIFQSVWFGPAQLVGWVPANFTSFTHVIYPPLPSGTKVQYYIRAQSIPGVLSPQSNAISVTMP